MLALVSAAVALVAIWWLDYVTTSHQLGTIACLLDSPRTPCWVEYPLGYNPSPPPVDYTASAVCALVLAGMAWWSKSAMVGTIYLLLGGLIALLRVTHPFILQGVSAYGPKGAIASATGWPGERLALLGVVMAIAGVVVIARSVGGRLVEARRNPATT